MKWQYRHTVGMRGGANITDQRLIKQMVEEGKSVEEIVRVTRIYPEVVNNWVDHFLDKQIDAENEEIEEERQAAKSDKPLTGSAAKVKEMFDNEEEEKPEEGEPEEEKE